MTPLLGVALTSTVTVKLAVAPTGREAMEQCTVPLAPAEGVVQVKVGPLSCDSLTKVTSLGRASVQATSAASDGPALLTSIVYVIGPPGGVESAEADFVIPT